MTGSLERRGRRPGFCVDEFSFEYLGLSPKGFKENVWSHTDLTLSNASYVTGATLQAGSIGCSVDRL